MFVPDLTVGHYCSQVVSLYANISCDDIRVRELSTSGLVGVHRSRDDIISFSALKQWPANWTRLAFRIDDIDGRSP